MARKMNIDFSVQPVSVKLSTRKILFYGAEKVGKTVTANDSNTFFLKFEDAHGHIEHRGAIIHEWADALAVLDAFRSQKGSLPFETVTLDTITKAFEFCQRHVLNQMRIQHESDGRYGKAYTVIKREFSKFVDGIAGLGLGVIMICHEDVVIRSNNLQGDARKEWEEVKPRLDKNAYQAVVPIVDCVLHFGLKWSPKEERYKLGIQTRSDEGGRVQAGCRYPPSWKNRMPDILPMSWDVLVRAWEKGAGAPPPVEEASPPVEEAPPPPVEEASPPVEEAPPSPVEEAPPPVEEAPRAPFEGHSLPPNGRRPAVSISSRR